MRKIKKYFKWIVIFIIIILIIGYIIIKCSLNNNESAEVVLDEFDLEFNENINVKEEREDLAIDSSKNFYVDIKGAVLNPGVYEIEENKKVIDVVNLAGGFTDNADTSLINLAKKVVDEMVIIIYTVEEVKNSKEPETVIKIIEKECVCPEINNDACINGGVSNKTEISDLGVVNINTASLDELLTLTGIGESKARAIIEYRESFGLFTTKEDIMNVDGIGESLYEKIKENITV